MKSLLATVCCLAFTGMASASITITGNGKVFYVPDVGYISVGISSDGKTAGEAWQQNGDKVRKIFEELKKLGIDPKDVKTVNLSIAPKYFYPRDFWGHQLDPVLVGYTANYDLSVTVRNLDKMGHAADALVENGGNRNMHVSFGASDMEKLIDQARAKSIADARKRANMYVTGAGASLGLVQSISEGYNAPQRLYQYEHAKMNIAADRPAPLPIAAGEQELTVSVTVTWTIAHTTTQQN